MNAPDLPVVRLRPNKPAQPLRFGAPWAYADTLVLDRRARALEPGSVVRLEDAARAPVGIGAFNAASRIAFRMLDRDPAAVIDQGWLEARIAAALALRDDLYDAPFYRLVHAEADGLPGVIVDRFGDAAVLQLLLPLFMHFVIMLGRKVPQKGVFGYYFVKINLS